VRQARVKRGSDEAIEKNNSKEKEKKWKGKDHGLGVERK